MAVLVDASLASQLVTLYAAQAVDALQPVMVMGSLINTGYDSNPGSVGNTVNVPIPVAPGVFTTTNLAEGNAITPQAPSITTAAVTINKHQVLAFEIPDALQAFTNMDVFATYAKPALIALATQVENDIIALGASLTSNTAVGTANTSLVSSVIDTAETELFNSYVPATDEKFLVTSGTAYSQLRSLAEFANTYQYGPDATALRTGELGMIKGFKVFRSQLITKVSTTTTNLGFARNAFALVTRAMAPIPQGFGAVSANVTLPGSNFTFRCVMNYNPNRLSVTGTWDCLYGVAVLRNGFGVQVLS